MAGILRGPPIIEVSTCKSATNDSSPKISSNSSFN